MKTTYANMPKELKARNSFDGSSVTAINTGKEYIVKSYKTQILKINLTDNTGIYNATNYSVTTRKIQYILEWYVLPYLKHIQYKNGLKTGVIL